MSIPSVWKYSVNESTEAENSRRPLSEEKTSEQSLHPPHPPSESNIFNLGFFFFNSTRAWIVRVSPLLSTRKRFPYKWQKLKMISLHLIAGYFLICFALPE